MTALKSGMFMFFDTDLKYDLPQSVIEIDRDKAAQLGLTMSQVGASLGSLLGGGYVNYFSMQTRSYKVIPQVERVSRLNADQLLDYPDRQHRRRAGSACRRIAPSAPTPSPRR